MSSPKLLAKWDLDHYWHAFTQMAEYESLIIDSAQGVWLYDVHGNRYLDGISSMWCTLHGHRHPVIDEAIRNQISKVSHATSLGVATPPAIELARRLAELAPGDLNHIFFGSDGSSAVEAALKIAFQYWQQCEQPRPTKTRYVALDGAYHGDTLGSASVGGIGKYTAIFEPLLFEVHRLHAPDSRLLPEGSGAEYFLQQLESLLEQHHQEIAALVIEPRIQAAAGMVFQPLGYLRGVRELTRKYNVLMIADEIVTGCGRTGNMFACESEGVVPDLLCLGKNLTGGYLPLSAAIASSEIYKAFLGDQNSGRAFLHGHTFGGNPLSAAAALASLDVLASTEVQSRLRAQCDQLEEILNELSAMQNVAEVRQLGMVGAVDLAPADSHGQCFPPELRFGHQVCREALKREVWMRPLGNTLVIMPPLCITKDELEFLGRVVLESIEAATQSIGPAALQPK
ncbi:adenosylmethionine--8-amino-7-oxononanoate transaminase [Bythopirellula goksoeyrii]|uniref:Adenosylmethionine-8-amino-7-oxononanoate aminotransferase n=1 Tax=Bythopirellula goksoeyrii TaxID=1400387 RepID=A0A5B9QD02_9BACT|nr:adenosylmethionine--8-amino-7-oxononanoate transaminase [Bythopirellula goksoeyrii]QEG35679.1 L-Lysine-8-amino-7-oxononanoate aminotransferase [Bythopirellula goksoeyrii]